MQLALSQYSRQSIIKQVFSENSSFIDRPALHIFLEIEQKYRIVVITEEQNLQQFSEIGVESYSVLQSEKVVQKILSSYGPKSTCLVLPDAPYVILENIFTKEGHHEI